MAGPKCCENFRMGKLHPAVVARRLVGIEREALAVLELGRAFGERAEPQLWSLQVDQDADRPAVARLNIADGLHQLTHLVVRGVAHVDAEHVRTGLEQLPDHRAVGRCRAERCENLDTTESPHCLGAAAGGGRPGAPRPGTPPGPLGPTVPGIPGTRCAGCSLASVSCTVHARCSPVSTSKKPVRSKPRARQFSVPLIVNSLSREHIYACPDHSPPRS